MQTVLGNAGNIVAFRVGPFDADLLEGVFRPRFGRADLERLPDYHAAARLLSGGVPLDPFVLRTLPWPLESPAHAHIPRVVRSRAPVHRETRIGGTRNRAEL